MQGKRKGWRERALEGQRDHRNNDDGGLDASELDGVTESLSQFIYLSLESHRLFSQHASLSNHLQFTTLSTEFQ